MNYQNPETQKKIGKAAKGLTTFGVLIFGLAVVLFSPKTSSQYLPDCSGISGTAEPGNNCLFYGMPLCQAVPNASYSISSSYVLASGTTASHRSNCANLSDLPLCGQIDGTANPGKNCVKECSDPSFTSANPSDIRGEDYAVHDRDCIRFCDSPESGITANSGVNCVGRKCHQLASGTNPNPPTNCGLLSCNLLTPDELNDPKFDDSSKKYCEGTGIKCFNFTLAQLPYVKMRPTNTMCTIHDCRATSETCSPFATDDVQQILDKGATYVTNYQTYITSGYSITSGTMCTPKICKPVVHRQYRCTPQEDTSPTTRNSSCDSSGDGATCTGGYCYKTIDCNLSANDSQPECATTQSVGSSIGTSDDSMKSWFYRPTPMTKSVSSSGIVKSMTENSGNDANSLCYTTDQMYTANSWGNWVIDYMHDYSLMDTRSPSKCDTVRLGSRGGGYIYLCGTNGLLYSIPSTSTAYHKGYVRTTFVEGNASHKLIVCLRFNNAMIPTKTCGARECGITCFFGSCSQVCGYDECYELTVTDNSPKECAMTSSIFDGSSGNKGCMAVIDDYLRVRAVKYGNHICTFLDLKGTLAYNAMYYNGTERLADNTCISGTNSTSGTSTCTNSINTNNSPGSASVWRTLIRIPYIDNNRPSGQLQGYLDRSGQLFPKQECIQSPYRITPPRTYNLATMENSPNMFSPPLYVLNSRIKRGSSVSPGSEEEPLGPTDFHYPELEVKFGSTTEKLSLGIGYTGFEVSSPDSQGSKTITTTVNNFTYTAEVFVKKEFSAASLDPIFCLYQKIKDQNGVYLDPARIECLRRNLPEIDNTATKAILPSIDLRKVKISLDSTSTYDNAIIKVNYLSSSDINAAGCSSANTSCTSSISLTNPDPSYANCSSDLEKYEICAQRDECSKLNNECIVNEMNLFNARAAGQSIDSFLTIQRNCNEILLRRCNDRKGISTSAGASAIDQNPTGETPNSNAYGWFNEICITRGFESKLRRIISYPVVSGVKGKCVISAASPYIADGNSDTNCNEGGKAPNCLCVNADEVVDTSIYVVRYETPHEAGLCVDIPLPQTCPAINYNLTPNSDINDLQYVLQSLNKDLYDNSTGVNLSHKYRTEGKPAPNAIPLKGHGEFPRTIFGLANVEGQCNGYWRYSNSYGVPTPPKLNCLNNNGVAEWEATPRDPCVRYQCPVVITSSNGIEDNGNYQSAYGALESGENKGLSNGFALWDSLTKTNDFTESATANSCIVGFKKNGALATTSSGTVTGDNAVTASLYNLITGYSGGTLPTRKCNQLGQWQTPTNLCQRITCPAVNPPTPANASDSAAWELWRNSGGATFPSVNASRSKTSIPNESISSGTCNESLGFFQAPGAPQPTRKCDYLGNWSAVINPCVTKCDAVTGSDASSSNNGYAYWDSVLNVPLSGEADGVLTSSSGNNGCVSGYYRYPYPPLRDKYGTSFTISSSGPYRTDSGVNSSLMTIPDNLANDTRAIGYPQRVCKSVITSGGSANVWTVTSSSCINNCVGSDLDPRIGAGKTQHSTHNSSVIIEWPTTNFGQWSYIDNPTITQQDASHYSSSTRTNGYYSLARYCNPTTHQWDNPIPQCATRSGSIGDSNAIYGTPADRTAVGSSVSGTCISGYGANGSNSIAGYQCAYKDGSEKIDEVYYSLTSGAACVRYCTVSPSETFGNAINPNSSSSSSIMAGQTVSLNCKSGYGSPVIGGSRTGVFYNCGRNPTDRADVAPYITCNADGTWTLSNDCSACRGCDGSLRSGGDSYSINQDGIHWTYSYNHSVYGTLNLSHNQVTEGCGYAMTQIGCYMGPSRAYLRKTCTDGLMSLSWSGDIYYTCGGSGWTWCYEDFNNRPSWAYVGQN